MILLTAHGDLKMIGALKLIITINNCYSEKRHRASANNLRVLRSSGTSIMHSLFTLFVVVDPRPPPSFLIQKSKPT